MQYFMLSSNQYQACFNFKNSHQHAQIKLPSKEMCSSWVQLQQHSSVCTVNYLELTIINMS